jgi:hypothetical protein
LGKGYYELLEEGDEVAAVAGARLSGGDQRKCEQCETGEERYEFLIHVKVSLGD